MNLHLRVATLGLTLFAFAALAHNGMEHLEGMITKVDGASITIKLEKGDSVVVLTDAKTEFKRGAASASLKDVAVGEKAVIHATEHEEKFLAKVVKLGSASSPNKAPDGGSTAQQEHHEHH